MASSAREEQAEGESESVGEAETNPCLECPGGCCSFKTINISYRTLDEGQRYDSMLLDELGEEGALNNLLFDDGEVPEMEWYIVTWPDGHRTLSFHCTHEEDGWCTEYDRRPGMCRTFSCAALEGEMELEEFLDEHGLEDNVIDHPETEVEEVTERVREIIGRAEL